MFEAFFAFVNCIIHKKKTYRLNTQREASFKENKQLVNK